MVNVIGHQHILGYLKDQIAQERLTHAYLFAGPQHVGKNTVARWFSAALLCHGAASKSLFGAASTEKPCGACPSCISLSKSTHPDLHLLELGEDDHSISIESMRGMLKHLSTSPTLGARKVTVINDAHTLTAAAANAFLKTLEEATASTTIIVITHQPQRLLPTIVSRCQTIEFARVTNPDSKLAQDPLWIASRGLPGKFLAMKDLGQDPDAPEKATFREMLSKRPGERFLAIDPLFKKSSAHADVKDVWRERLAIWQIDLVDLMHETLASADSRTPAVQIQRWIDDLERIREASSAPINLRAHIEGFLASIPPL